MVFVIGLICFLVGFVTLRLFGCTPLQHAFKQYNKWDYIGTTLFFLGILLMIISACIKLWHLLP